MFSLVVNPDTDQAWGIALSEGVHTLGRSSDNAIVLEHGSISSRHCEIVVTRGKATLRDLGSTAGSFVDGQLVEVATLTPGRRFKLGEVELELVTDGPAAPSTVGPPASAVAAAAAAHAARRCKHHHRAPAHWRCPGCGHFYCELCVSVRPGGKLSNHFCRRCGGECEPVAGQVTTPAERSFFAQLPGVFSYPFKGNGVVLLIAGTVFFLILKAARFLASFAPLIGLPAIAILAVLTSGYLFNYAKRIITASVEEDEGPPDWPEFSDWFEDLVVPFGQCIALCLACYGPAGLLHIWQPLGPEVSPIAALAAMGIGALVFPMGMLAVAMFDRVLALNPLLLVASILRMPLQYLVAAIVFEVIIVLYWFGDYFVAALLPVPILPRILSVFISLYLIVIGMRTLGLLYRANKERLGWF